MVIVIAQAAVGQAMVLGSLPLVLALMHNLLAAGLLVALVLLL
jgi:heme A synthase